MVWPVTEKMEALSTLSARKAEREQWEAQHPRDRLDGLVSMGVEEVMLEGVGGRPAGVRSLERLYRPGSTRLEAIRYDDGSVEWVAPGPTPPTYSPGWLALRRKGREVGAHA